MILSCWVWSISFNIKESINVSSCVNDVSIVSQYICDHFGKFIESANRSDTFIVCCKNFYQTQPVFPQDMLQNISEYDLHHVLIIHEKTKKILT